MKLNLPYGKTGLTLDTNGIRPVVLARARRRKEKFDAKMEFRNALGAPAGTGAFKSIFSASDSVAIIVPDKTRPNAFKPLLPELLSALNTAGIKKSRITFILATGMHSGHTEAEKNALLGKSIAGRYRIIDHDSRNTKELAYTGTTSRGTKVFLNKHAVNADRLITIGIAGYHYYAGYNGGRKMVMPGIAGYETIQQNHGLVLNPSPARGKNPMAVSGVLEGNPVHEDMLEAAKLCGVDFAINLVLDAGKNIAGIFTGDIEKSHLQACRKLNRLYHVKIGKRADCVIVSAGGYPRDINYVQSHKSIETASKALKPGGTMIVFAECADGFGSEKIREWFRYGDTASVEKRLRRRFEVPGHTVLVSLLKSGRYDIYLHSGMKQDEVKLMQLKPLSGLSEAGNILKQFKDKTVYAITDGTVIMPVI